jgi:monofunctional glycosyltransferase
VTGSRSSSKGKRRRRARRAASVIGRTLAATAAAAFASLVYLHVTLPDVRPLRSANPATTAFIELRAQEARARGESPRRVQQWVPYGRISPNLSRAVLVAEDAAFWRHDGIDYAQIRESIEVNLERRAFARGASTITQQLAKNLYLTPSRNPVRKLRELWIARRLEAELSKARILELYLNVIEWGDGIYGAEAAAQTYFGRSSAVLGPEESALLAAAIINPRLLDPGRPSARLRQRQQLVLRRMGVRPAGPSPRSAAVEPADPRPAPTSNPAGGAEDLPTGDATDEPCGTEPCG